MFVRSQRCARCICNGTCTTAINTDVRDKLTSSSDGRAFDRPRSTIATSQTDDSSVKLRIRQLYIWSERSSSRQPSQRFAPTNQMSFILCRHLANRLRPLVNRTKTIRYAVPFSSFCGLGFSPMRVWLVTNFCICVC